VYTNVTIEVNDSPPYHYRNFLVYVPREVTGDARVPAMINIHGFSSSPYYVNLLSGIPIQDTGTNALQAGAYGWVIASPFGTAPEYNPTCCKKGLSKANCQRATSLDSSNPCSYNAGGCCGSAKDGFRNDVGFIRGIAEWLEENACVNKENIFAMGFSNGGMMTNRLACEAADVFRGVAPFQGDIRIGGDFAECKPSRPISWISFCGTEDGACVNGQNASFKLFAENNKCVGEPTPTYVTPTTKCEAYTSCEDGTFVETCMNEGMGHSFSGHLRPGSDISPGYQPPTNVDGFKYVMNRLSNVLAR
jgi:polyhydroxybutyrate depolymerase